MAPRFFENANYDFVSDAKRRQTKMLSIAVLLFAIIPGLVWQMAAGSWYNFGVDFTGGTVVQVNFTEPVSLADLRGIVNSAAPSATPTQFGGNDQFLVRAPVGVDISQQLTQALTDRFTAQGFTIGRAEEVGPKVGSELRTKAVTAIALSFLATLIYLAFRLQISYGVAAIAATVHDIIFSLGLIAALHLEVSLTTVAALLTIIGYSMNDKIVIFDRIRENAKKHHRRSELTAMVNRSINETLPRTVMTGGSVLAVLFVLFLLGGIALRDFALIMFLGITVGTYSSIWVGPAVLLWFEEKWPHKSDTVRTRTPATRPERPTAAPAAKARG